MDGWEPRTVTEFERDGDGRVVRAVEYRESEFDEEQYALMLAYHRFESDLGPHGHLMSEATDERANPNEYDGGYRYVADGPVTDWAEKARLDRIDAYRKELGDNANLNGVLFPVRKVVDLPPGE